MTQAGVFTGADAAAGSSLTVNATPEPASIDCWAWVLWLCYADDARFERRLIR